MIPQKGSNRTSAVRHLSLSVLSIHAWLVGSAPGCQNNLMDSQSSARQKVGKTTQSKVWFDEMKHALWSNSFLMQWISSTFFKCWKLSYSIPKKCWKFIASKILEIKSWHLTWVGPNVMRLKSFWECRISSFWHCYSGPKMKKKLSIFEFFWEIN